MFSDFFSGEYSSPEKMGNATNMPSRNMYRPNSQLDASQITQHSHIHSVAVHVTKVASLPEPFTLHEFRMVCQMNGLPVDDVKQRKHKQYEVTIQPQMGLKISQKSQNMINDFCDQLYATYLQLYEQFRLQHKLALRQNHQTDRQYLKHKNESSRIVQHPETIPALKEYTTENMEATNHHKRIVQLLITLSQQTPGTLLNQYASLAKGEIATAVSGQIVRNKINQECIEKVAKTERTEKKPTSDAFTKRSQSQGSSSSLENVQLEVIRTQRMSKPGQPQIPKLKLSKWFDKDIGHDQESQVRERALEKEKQNLMSYRWNDDFKSDKDLIVRDEPEFVAALRKKFIQRTLELQELGERVEKIKQGDLDARKDANKEIQLSRQIHDVMNLELSKADQKGGKLKAKDKKPFFNVQIFDVTKGLNLDPELKDALADKFQNLSNMYESKFRLLATKAENLEEHIKLMNQIQSENIKPKDLTMEKLIELLARIEENRSKAQRRVIASDPYTGHSQFGNRPNEIWQKFHECFGPDYFLEIIEEEYGIAPGQIELMQQKMQDFFMSDMQKIKSTLQKSIEQNKTLTNKLQESLSEKNEEIANLKRRADQTVEEFKKYLSRQKNIIVKEIEDSYLEKHTREVTLLRQHILKIQQENASKLGQIDKYQMAYAFRKMQMYTLISQVLDNDKECCRVRLCKFRDSDAQLPVEQRMCLRSRLDDQMRQRLLEFIDEQKLALQDPRRKEWPMELYSQKQLIDEMTKMKVQNAEDKFMLAIYKNQNNLNSVSVQDLRGTNEQLLIQLDIQKARQPIFLIENDILKRVNEQLKEQIKLLSERIETSEKRWKTNAQQPYMLTFKNLVKAFELKASNEFAQILTMVAYAPRIANTKEKKMTSSLTDMCNLDIQIGPFSERYNNFKDAQTETDVATTKEKAIQTSTSMVDADVQTKETKHASSAVQVDTLAGKEGGAASGSPTSNRRTGIQALQKHAQMPLPGLQKQATQTYVHKVTAQFQGGQVGLMAINKKQPSVMPHHAPKTAKLLKHLSLKPQNLKASHAQKQTESNSPNMRVETGTSNTLDEVENFSQHIQSRRHQKSAQKEQSPTTKFQTGGNKQKSSSNVFNKLQRKQTLSTSSKKLLKSTGKQTPGLSKDVIYSDLQIGVENDENAGSTQKEVTNFLNNKKFAKHSLIQVKNVNPQLSNLKNKQFAASQRILLPKAGQMQKAKETQRMKKQLSKSIIDANSEGSVSDLAIKVNNAEAEDDLDIEGQPSEDLTSNNFSEVYDKFKQNPPCRRITEKEPHMERGSPDPETYDDLKPHRNLDVHQQTNDHKLRHGKHLPEESPAKIRMSVVGSAIGPEKRSIIKPVLQETFPVDSDDQLAPAVHHQPLTFARGSARMSNFEKSPNGTPLHAAVQRAMSQEVPEIIQVVDSKPKIQQLLLKGYITEEQYIALNLLEKGLLSAKNLPGSQPTVFSATSYNKFSKIQRPTNEVIDELTTNFQSQLSWHPQKPSRLTMYSSTGNLRHDSPPQTLQGRDGEPVAKFKTARKKGVCKQQMKVVRTGNIMVLQKIFDKVFIQKKEASTQLDYMNDSFERSILLKSKFEKPSHSQDQNMQDILSINGIGGFRTKRAKREKVRFLRNARSVAGLSGMPLPLSNSSSRQWKN